MERGLRRIDQSLKMCKNGMDRKRGRKKKSQDGRVCFFRKIFLTMIKTGMSDQCMYTTRDSVKCPVEK